MNYCQKIRYAIYTAEKDDFPRMIDKLLGQLPKNETVLRLVFFGMPQLNEQYLERRRIVWGKVYDYFGNNLPALSYVSQPPLNAALLMEVHSYCETEEDSIRFGSLEHVPYVVIENNRGRFLFAGGFQGNIMEDTIREQAVDVFRQIEALLVLEHFPVNSIIRQWNYIEKITGSEGGNQHYQSFNNARSDFYAITDWDNGYPAATGIGTELGGVLIDLDAALFTSPDTYATPIDNNLQIAAHAYSEDVLLIAQDQKKTPKFERAKSITCGDQCLIYISGTAAIRGEESLRTAGLEEQISITMENIARLTQRIPLVMLRVYLKNKQDYKEAARLMSKYTIPVSYMCADVCRDELLVEIEGIAMTDPDCKPFNI